MPRLRCILVVVTALVLVVASHIASMASVIDASAAFRTDGSVPAQSDPMSGCGDCGRDAVPANACAMHCMIPPSDIDAPTAWVALPSARLMPACVVGFEGRAPAPDLHPPRANA